MTVKLNISNYGKCLCPVCPVQLKSACIAAKNEEWRLFRLKVGEILKEYHLHPEAYEMDMQELEKNVVGKKHSFTEPKPAGMQELYCSEAVGKSNCGDLDEGKMCQCPDCVVWQQNKLGSTYFCLSGSA